MCLSKWHRERSIWTYLIELSNDTYAKVNGNVDEYTRAHTRTHTRVLVKSNQRSMCVLLSTMATKYSWRLLLCVCVCLRMHVIQTEIMILTHDDPYLNWRNIQQFAVIDAIPSQ